MSAKTKLKIPKGSAAGKIQIDYKNVSSVSIMEQIKKEISGQDRPPERAASAGNEKKKGKAMKSFIKKVVFKLARPFRPVIKVFIHDSFQDLMAETHERLRRLEQEEGDERKKEYIKLLYGLSHNIVVELTKLKIEVEDLRVKLSILEKEFENFKKRERALEKRVVK